MGKKLKAAVVGLGFIGPAHIEGIKRCRLAKLEAVVSRSEKKANAFAEDYDIPRVYRSIDDLLEDGGIDVVHNCTPNFLHYEINRKVLEAGVHLFSEKPLTMSSEEAKRLVELAARKGVAAGVNFNYRLFPMVIEAKGMIERGELGNIFAVQGEYIQDWLLHDTDYDWRLKPEMAGLTRAVGDIGTHAFDLLQYLSGKTIAEVIALLKTIYPIRKKPLPKPGEYEEIKIATEDYAAILLRLEDDIPGSLTVSQVTAGKKNGLHVRLDGEKGSLEWFQEDPNRLYIGRRDRPNQVVMRDPALVGEDAARFIFYPGGHEEGFPDAIKNSVLDFYSSILNPNWNRHVASLYDGYLADLFIEAAARSHKERSWVKIEADKSLRDQAAGLPGS